MGEGGGICGGWLWVKLLGAESVAFCSGFLKPPGEFGMGGSPLRSSAKCFGARVVELGILESFGLPKP